MFTSKCVGTGPSSYEKEFTGPRSHKVKKRWRRPLSQRQYFFHTFVNQNVLEIFGPSEDDERERIPVLTC